MAMTRMPPDQIAQKWVQNLSGATQTIRAGVAALDYSPMERAASRADAYIQGIQEAVSSGRWQASLRAVTLDQWKDAMISKGLPRIALGAQQAQGKFTRFMVRWMSFQASLQQRLNQMPRGNLQQNIQRAIFVISESAAQRGKMGGNQVAGF